MDVDENKFDYVNAYVPNKWYHGYEFYSSEILQKCLRSKQHICSSIVGNSADLFPSPVILQCKTLDMQHLYLHTYGLRKSVYLKFKSMTFRHTDTFQFVKKLRDSFNLNIVDAKIVHKTPLESACMGQNLFLKLYAGKFVSWKNLSAHLSDHPLVHPEIFDKNTTPYNLWMTRNDSRPSGVLTAGNVKFFGNRSDTSKKDMHIFYKDVLFDNCTTYTLSLEEVTLLHGKIMSSVNSVIRDNKISRQIEKLLSRTSLSLDMFTAFVRVGDCYVITWDKIKTFFLHSPFMQMISNNPIPGYTKSILEVDDDVFDGYVFELYEELQIGKPTNGDIHQVFVDLIILKGIMRRMLKSFWAEYKNSVPDKDERIQTKDDEHMRITRQLKCVFFDIETDFEPNVKKEETVTSIAAISFDHVGDMPIQKYFVFVRIAEEIVDKFTVECELHQRKQQMMDVCFDGLKDYKNNTFFNFNNCDLSQNFHLKIYRDELVMLEDFLRVVRNEQTDFIAGFNSNRFDFPFVNERVNRLRYRKSTDLRPKYLKCLQLSDKHDEAYVKYTWKKKKKAGDCSGYKGEPFILSMDSECSSTTEDGRDSDVDDDIDAYLWEVDPKLCEQIRQLSIAETIQETPKSPLANPAEKNFLVSCRDIASLTMNTVTVADIMILVGGKDRPCKLDNVCYETFHVRKVHNENTTYENLCKTWKSGNVDALCDLVGYNMRDVVLLYMLVKAKGCMLFIGAMSIETGVQVRELFANESIKTVQSLIYKYGYLDDVVVGEIGTHDELARVNKYNKELVSFNILDACGGRSVQMFGIFDLWALIVDYAGQYPSIMMRNVNISAVLDMSFIEEHKLQEGKDYFRVRVPNVWAKPTGSCVTHGDNETLCSLQVQKCVYSTENVIVYKDMYYASDTYFKGYCNRISYALRVKRQVYKDLIKKSIDVTNNKAREMAVKVTGNSVYGVLLKMNPSVGGSVTQIAREDIENVAKLAHRTFGYPVITGDTDSVFLGLMDKTDTVNFSSMSKALSLSGTPSVRTIVGKMYEKANNFTRIANQGCPERNISPAHPHPSKLEVEKIFPTILITTKKCYMGYKVLPEKLSLELHMSGMSGKKVDTSRVKTMFQLITYRLLQKRDMKGLLLFMYHICELVGRELHVNEIIEDQKMVLTEKRDKEGMDALTANLDTFRKSLFAGNIKLDLLRNEEKVGDLSKMNTISAKKAKVYCFENGLPLEKAPMSISMYRNFEVQVSGFLTRILKVILSSPLTNSQRVQRTYIGAGREQKWKSLQTHMPDMLMKKKLSDDKVTRLHITTMPSQYVSQKKDRRSIDSCLYNDFRKLLVSVLLDELQRKKQRKELVESGKLSTSRLYLNDCHIYQGDYVISKQEAVDRLTTFIENTNEKEVHPPTYMFDEHFAVSSISQMKKLSDHSYEISPERRSVLLWFVYLSYLTSIGCPKRYIILHSTNISVVVTFSDTYDISSEQFTYDMNSLLCFNVKTLTSDQSYVLDMHSYREQTLSTPLIVESYDGGLSYLVNNDSYVPCVKNALSFRVSLGYVQQALKNYSTLDTKSEETVTFKNVVGQRSVKLNGLVIPVAAILRDDTLFINKWLWEIPAVHVNAAWLYHVLTKGNQSCGHVDMFCCEHLNLLKIVIGEKKHFIHMTDGSSKPRCLQETNAHQVMMSKSQVFYSGLSLKKSNKRTRKQKCHGSKKTSNTIVEMFSRCLPVAKRFKTE